MTTFEGPRHFLKPILSPKSKKMISQFSEVSGPSMCNVTFSAFVWMYELMRAVHVLRGMII